MRPQHRATPDDMRRALIGAAIAGLMLCAGCPVTEVTDEPTAQTGEAQGPALRVSTPIDQQNPEFEELDLFLQQRPGIDVKWEPNPARGYLDKLKTLVAGREAPDVFIFDDEPFHALATRNAFLDLKPLAEKHGFDLGALAPWARDTFTVDEHLYGLASGGGADVLFYNRGLFEANGLEPPNEEWTWDDLLAAARALTVDRNDDGVTDQWGFLLPTDWWPQWLWAVWSAGGEVLNEEHTACLLDSPEALRGLRFCADLVLEHKVAPRAAEGEMAGMRWAEMFCTGKIAMMIGLPFLAYQIDENSDFDFDMTFVPTGPAGRVTRYTASPWVISADTTEPDAAWELLSFLVGEQVQKRNIARYPDVPSLLALQGEAFRDKPDSPWNEAATYGALQHARMQPLIPQYDEMRAIVQHELDRAMVEQQSLEAAVEKITAQVDDLLGGSS